MYILKPRSHCPGSPRCVPVKRAGKPDKQQNSPSPPPPPPHKKMSVFTTVGKARVVFLVLPRCRYVHAGRCTLVLLRLSTVASRLRWRPGDCRTCLGFVPVFPGIENNSERRETQQYRVEPGFTVDIVGVWF